MQAAASVETTEQYGRITSLQINPHQLIIYHQPGFNTNKIILEPEKKTKTKSKKKEKITLEIKKIDNKSLRVICCLTKLNLLTFSPV